MSAVVSLDLSLPSRARPCYMEFFITVAAVLVALAIWNHIDELMALAYGLFLLVCGLALLVGIPLVFWLLPKDEAMTLIAVFGVGAFIYYAVEEVLKRRRVASTHRPPT